MTAAEHTAADVIRHVALAAARYAIQSGGDPDEISQRVLVTIGEAVREGRADWAFVVVSIRNAVASIARHDRRARRSPSVPVIVAHSGLPVADAMAEQKRIDLRIDIDSCLAREGENVRRLCSLLETMTVAEAAVVMGVPRSTLRGWLASLRERMEARGLGVDG
jgi:DNA-directed RNA polymerase specialized sigma24 family protein